MSDILVGNKPKRRLSRSRDREGGIAGKLGEPQWGILYRYEDCGVSLAAYSGATPDEALAYWRRDHEDACWIAVDVRPLAELRSSPRWRRVAATLAGQEADGSDAEVLQRWGQLGLQAAGLSLTTPSGGGLR